MLLSLIALYMKSLITPQMRVIEFLGQARSGKTTQVLLLKEYLEEKGFRVALSLDRERAKMVHASVSNCLAFNLIFHSKVIDEYYRTKNAKNIDFFIVDRGFCDVAIWAEVLYRLKQISKKNVMRILPVGSVFAH